MAARSLAWAQRVVNGPATTFGINLNASTNTALDPKTSATAMTATDQTFEVSAGVSVSVRWGGTSSVLFGALATNTQTWLLNCFYDIGTNLWETAATDTLVDTAGTTTCDRTLTFTPTHSGTVRLVAKYTSVVTVGGALVSTVNTDGGNTWGAGAETLPATSATVGFTPGLVRCGGNLTSLTVGGLTTATTQGYFPDLASLTFVRSVAPRSVESAFSYAVNWLDHLNAAFGATDTIAASTATSMTAVTRTINPATGFPAANEKIGVLITPGSSSLSAANSGTALPWTHWATTPSSPGTVTRTNDAAGNAVAVRFGNGTTQAFLADPRLQVHAHAQKDSLFVLDSASPAPFGTYSADFYLYIISADLFYGWFAAFNMNNVGQPSITGTVHLADTTVTTPVSGGGGDHTSTLTTTAVGNLLSAADSSFEDGTTGTFTAGASTAIANSSTFALDGTKSLRLASTGGTHNLIATSATGTAGYAVAASTQYTAVADVRSTNARTAHLDVNWYTSAGTFISTSAGANITTTNTGFTLMSCTATSPATAAYASLSPNIVSAAGGDFHYTDEYALHAGASTTWVVGPQTLGWSPSPSPYNFTPAPPAGHWHWWCETATDGTSTWTRLNSYLVFDQGNADDHAPYATFASGVNFVSAYRDNLYVTVRVATDTNSNTGVDFPRPGQSALVTAVPLKDTTGAGNFSIYAVDTGTTPILKIVRYNQATDVQEFQVGSDSAGVAMTLAPDGLTWLYDWVTSSSQDQDVYLALVEMQLDGGSKLNQAIFFIRVQPSTFDAVAFATSIDNVISFK